MYVWPDNPLSMCKTKNRLDKPGLPNVVQIISNLMRCYDNTSVWQATNTVQMTSVPIAHELMYMQCAIATMLTKHLRVG